MSYIKGFAVALEKEFSEEDADKIAGAILMIRGVLNITPIERTGTDWIVEQKVIQKLRSEIIEVFNELGK